MHIVDLARPSLTTLSFLLRNKQYWPRGFKWYFGSCDACALGLAMRIWRFDIDHSLTRHVAEALHVSASDMKDLLVLARWAPTIPKDDRPDYISVTPEMVADQIDKYLLLNPVENPAYVR